MNFDEFTNPVDVTAQYDGSDITANKGMACAACFPILFWLPMVVCKESGFAKFYANQGLITLILSVSSSVITAILSIIPILGTFLAPLVSLVLGVATVASFVFTLYNAAQGNAKYIPVLGQMIEVFK